MAISLEASEFVEKSFDEVVITAMCFARSAYGSCVKGNRPSFYEVMPPDQAKIAYEAFAEELKKSYP